MSHKTGIPRRTWRERVLSLFLAAVLLLGMAPELALGRRLSGPAGGLGRHAGRSDQQPGRPAHPG